MSEEAIMVVGDSTEMEAKFNAIRERARKIVKEKTSKDRIKVREGAKGKQFRYVQRVDAFRWLDKHYPGWSFEVIPGTFVEQDDFFMAIGKLTVIEPEGLKRVVQCVGSIPIKYDRNSKERIHSEYYKSVETDAIKRCVASLGAFSDIYSDYEDSLDSHQTTEDLIWFLHSFLPILVSRNEDNPARVFTAVNSFYYGNTTKQQIINIYTKQGITL